jgi:hypothetical protein
MPTIPLLDNSDDGARLLSHMYFPNREADREALFAALRAESEPEKSIWMATSAAPTSKGERKRALELAETGWRGTVAGEILLFVVRMQRTNEREPSVRKAMFAVRDGIIEHMRDDTGYPEPAPEDAAVAIHPKSFWNYYLKFKDVRHFWAAHRILELEREVPFYRMHEALAEPQQREEFLAHAAWFLDFETHFTARNLKGESLVDLATVWTPSRGVPAREPHIAVDSDSLRELLSRYPRYLKDSLLAAVTSKLQQ